MTRPLFRSVVMVPMLSALSLFAAGAPAVAQPKPQRLAAEAPIWGANNGENGYAFLSVTIQGHKGTLVINLNNEGDLSLSPAALSRIGVTLPETATQLDAFNIGSDVQHNIPVRIIAKPGWAVHGPDGAAEIVGIAGVHFLMTHYDILYDFPHRIVRLYAFPPKPVAARNVWLPPGINASDCGKLIPIPSGAATFTGMEVKLDGHPVTGVIEMMPYGSDEQGDEKMNEGAVNALALPANSPRLEPIPGQQPFLWHGREVKDRVTDVHISIGSNTFWTGPVKIFPILDVEAGLPPNTSVMLLNLTTIHHQMLYNSVSGKKVCLSKP